MPTKTSSPSWISRAAAATISSPALASGIGVADGDAGRAGANAGRGGAQPVEVRRAVGHAEHPLLEPGLEALRRARPGRVLAVGGVVARPAALERRRVRAPRLVDDGRDLDLGQQ